MSATNRSARGGGPHDNFPTHAWCVRRLLEAWKPIGGTWVEPGAGHGELARAVLACRPDVSLIAVEIDDVLVPSLSSLDRVEVVRGDFRAVALPARAEVSPVVIGNPPYRDDMALAFVTESMMSCPVAHVAFLLPLAFLATRGRHGFLAANPPDLWVLPDRPKFRGDGTDQAEYAWFVWPPSVFRGRGQGTVRVLALTPKEERRADELAARERLLAAIGPAGDEDL